MGRNFSPEPYAATKNAVTMTMLAEQFHQSAHRQVALEKRVDARPDQSREFKNLTQRQLQVLHCIEQGWPNKLIAHHLGITANTLKSHIKILFRSLGVSSRSQALIAGRAMRLKVEKAADGGTRSA